MSIRLRFQRGATRKRVAPLFLRRHPGQGGGSSASPHGHVFFGESDVPCLRLSISSCCSCFPVSAPSVPFHADSLFHTALYQPAGMTHLPSSACPFADHADSFMHSRCGVQNHKSFRNGTGKCFRPSAKNEALPCKRRQGRCSMSLEYVGKWNGRGKTAGHEGTRQGRGRQHLSGAERRSYAS